MVGYCHTSLSGLIAARTTSYPHYPKSFVIVWAAHNASDAMVNVGLPVATVGKTPLPTMNKLGWSRELKDIRRASLFTFDFFCEI